jgi:hypothetical protein
MKIKKLLLVKERKEEGLSQGLAIGRNIKTGKLEYCGKRVRGVQ